MTRLWGRTCRYCPRSVGGEQPTFPKEEGTARGMWSVRQGPVTPPVARVGESVLRAGVPGPTCQTDTDASSVVSSAAAAAGESQRSSCRTRTIDPPRAQNNWFYLFTFSHLIWCLYILSSQTLKNTGNRIVFVQKHREHWKSSFPSTLDSN